MEFSNAIANAVVGTGAVIESSEVKDSIIGAHAEVKNVRGSMSVTDHSVVTGA